MSTKIGDEKTIARFGNVCGFTADAGRREALGNFGARVRMLNESARKLLAHIAELAYREHHDGRKPGVAYLPELHETCGLGVDEMYDLLKELEQGDFIQVEGEYPFQDVALRKVPLEGAEWALMLDLWKFSQSERISLRDLLVDVKFERV